MDYLRMWLPLALGHLAFLLLPHHSEGACVYQGSLYANNTEWKPDSCQDCTCHNDIVVCDVSHCRDPQCDFTKGEVLRIERNKCCPECASKSQGFCSHEGIVHAHGTQWTQSECTVCTCMNGKVTCALKPCPRLHCKNGEIEHVAPGECCPVCVGTGESCSLDGHLLRDGEDWKLSQCSRCTCKNGVTRCFTADCLPLLCDKDEILAVVPGKCCPECLPKSCTISGKTYEHGVQWTRNSCTTCMCDRGEVRCHTKPCYPRTCEKGKSRMRRPGQCCEECVSSKGSCVSEGIVRYHGELWNGSHCDFCLCDRGKVLCHKAQCAKVECSWGEELVHLDGKCCPECIASSSYCIYKAHIKESLHSDLSGIKHLMNGEKWRESLCRECECQNGQVVCFSPSCPSCPVGTLAVDVVGECCPECKPVQCNPDCLTCSRSIEHCDICRDETRALQMGRCVYTCDPGFYLDGKTCIACKESCSSCKNGFECTSCEEHLLMKDGQCVLSCGDGYFQEQRGCAACHESCSACQGPSESDCLMCKDLSQVKQGGLCTASCDNGFYALNGTCAACDPSCQSCSSDNSRCLICAPGRLFHRGQCVQECPDGHYIDPAGLCTACHKECASCSGPLANQCTSCLPRFALLRGQCLRDCGEGHYSDGSLCKACHLSCRACVGPEDSHCTQCVNPEDVLQAVQEYGGKPYGMCQAQCKLQFYVNSTGICQECHSSCSRCIGRGISSCIACNSPNKLHNGICRDSCPEGFYIKESTCYTCHPSCKECTGPYETECLSCHPHATLTGGSCKTTCADGQYLNLVGYCVDCHPQCQQCVANLHGTGSMCVKCQYSRYYFVGDHCAPECPVGYHAEGRICKSCHPSCKSCSGPGVSSCMSCDAGLVLSHNGMCSQTCSMGYYRDGHICKPCNRQCLTCDSAAGCTACRDPTKVLLFGECQYDSCTQQYYLDYTSRTCKECDWSCNACKGPLKSDCLQCMEQYTLHAGACVEQCPPSFYKHGEACQECGEHCLLCHGPADCSQCESPFYLLDGQCVRECGPQHQVSHYDQKCVECPPGCLNCDDSKRCRLCDSKMFLKDHVCVSHCGPGFSANPTNRRCEDNVHAPILLVNGSLTVGIGGVRALDLSIMSVQDQDTENDGIIFHVLHTPTNGRLVKVSFGKEVQLNKDTHFGLEDLREQRVRFKHSKEKSRNGYFLLKVSDGQLFSQPKTINIQAVSTKATFILKNEALVVGKGEAGAITGSVLDLRDDDNPQDVVVVVLEAPRHGQLVIPPGTSPIHKFRLDDIRNGILHYVHDGSASQSDLILLQANDGYYFQNILFRITVTDKTSGGLQLVLNSAVWVPERGMLQISNRLLQARAFGAADSQIVYTILNEHPRFGDVVLLVPVPADGPADGWQRLPDGRVATSVSSFTQQDINEGLVWYRHSGSQSQGRDSFSFQV